MEENGREIEGGSRAGSEGESRSEGRGERRRKDKIVEVGGERKEHMVIWNHLYRYLRKDCQGRNFERQVHSR